MNSIYRHIPNYIDAEETFRGPYEFEDLNELKRLKFVRELIHDDNFYCLSVARDGRSRQQLMFESKDGRYMVIGHLQEDVPELPQWDLRVCRDRPNKVDT